MPLFTPTSLPAGFDAELRPGSGGQIEIGPQGSIFPIEPVDTAVHHYAGTPGHFIDIYPGSLPGYRAADTEPIAVLGTTGQLGAIEDGYKVEFSIDESPCGSYAILGYGLSLDDFKDVISGLVARK